MSERLRKFKDLAEEIKALKKPQEDASGRRMVRIGMEEDYDLLSPLSPNSEPYITSDAAQFLEQSTKHAASASYPTWKELEKDLFEYESHSEMPGNQKR